MPLRFFRNCTYAPVNAFYFNLSANNRGDLRHVAFLDTVQNQMIAANHLSGVAMAVIFDISNYIDNKRRV
jgi:hypothetical protein